MQTHIQHYIAQACCCAAQEQAPTLHDFLAWDRKGNKDNVSSRAQHLSKELMRLPKAAYIPAELKDFKCTSKRTDKQVLDVACKHQLLVFSRHASC